MHRALLLTAVAAGPRARRRPRDAIATLAGTRQQLGLADLGWDDSVSTTASLNSLPDIHDEIAAALAAAP